MVGTTDGQIERRWLGTGFIVILLSLVSLAILTPMAAKAQVGTWSGTEQFSGSASASGTSVTYSGSGTFSFTVDSSKQLTGQGSSQLTFAVTISGCTIAAVQFGGLDAITGSVQGTTSTIDDSITFSGPSSVTVNCPGGPVTVPVAPFTAIVHFSLGLQLGSSTTATYGALVIKYTLSSAPAPTSSATSVKCDPDPVAVNPAESTCTATVSGLSPTGSVTFSSDSKTGGFPKGDVCDLASGPTSGSCSVQYWDTQAGTAVITASYGGDSNNLASNGAFSLQVGAASSSSSTTPACGTINTQFVHAANGWQVLVQTSVTMIVGWGPSGPIIGTRVYTYSPSALVSLPTIYCPAPSSVITQSSSPVLLGPDVALLSPLSPATSYNYQMSQGPQPDYVDVGTFISGNIWIYNYYNVHPQIIHIPGGQVIIKAATNISLSVSGTNGMVFAKGQLFSSSGAPLNNRGVVLKLNTQPLTNVITSSNGSYSYNLGQLQPGSYALNSTFGGDEYYLSSSAGATFTVSATGLLNQTDPYGSSQSTIQEISLESNGSGTNISVLQGNVSAFSQGGGEIASLSSGELLNLQSGMAQATMESAKSSLRANSINQWWVANPNNPILPLFGIPYGMILFPIVILAVAVVLGFTFIRRRSHGSPEIRAGTTAALSGPSSALQQAPMTAATVEAPAIKCPSCNSPISENDSFCDNCGINLSQGRICHTCGTRNLEDAVYCGNCGKVI